MAMPSDLHDLCMTFGCEPRYRPEVPLLVCQPGETRAPELAVVLPLDERYDFDLVLEDEMHVNAGLDKLVKINFRNDPFQYHSRS